MYWSIKQAQWEAQRRVDENEGLPHHLRGLLGEDARKLAAEKTQKMQKEARKRRMVAQPGSEAGRKIMSFRVYVNFLFGPTASPRLPPPPAAPL